MNLRYRELTFWRVLAFTIVLAFFYISSSQKSDFVRQLDLYASEMAATKRNMSKWMDQVESKLQSQPKESKSPPVNFVAHPVNQADPDLKEREQSMKNPSWLDLHMEKYFKDPLKLGHLRDKPGYLAIGVPTVARDKAYYLPDTVRGLVTNLKREDWNEVVIVVFVADLDHVHLERVMQTMRTNFTQEIDEGLIQVVHTNPSFYPKMKALPLLYGDSIKRTRWRSKQSLDYSYLYFYCARMGKYYLQLEDDVFTEPNYLPSIKKFIDRQTAPWSTLEFGARGFIGMMYETKHLVTLSKFVRLMYWTMPVDWTFRWYNDVFLHGNAKKSRYNVKNPIFKHVGKFSSLPGQVRKLEDMGGSDKELKKLTNYQSKFGNPSAKVTTTIKEWVRPYGVEMAYAPNGVYWAKTPKVGDSIRVEFPDTLRLKKVVFASGNQQYPGDILDSSELQISEDCDSFTTVQAYESASLVVHMFSNQNEPVKCVKLVLKRISFDERQKPRWLVISDIAVWTL